MSNEEIRIIVRQPERAGAGFDALKEIGFGALQELARVLAQQYPRRARWVANPRIIKEYYNRQRPMWKKLRRLKG